MRRRLAVPFLLSLLLAAACGDGGGAADVAGEVPQLTAGAAFGEEPTIEVKGDPPADTQFSVLSEGDGPAVRGGDLLVADVKLRSWEDGGADAVADNTFSGDPMVKTIGKGEITPGWDEKIPGVTVGSRVLLVERVTGQNQADGEGDAAGETLVFVIDILDSFDAKVPVDGEAVGAEKGLPKVIGESDPEITIPDGDPPRDLVAQLILRGKGPEVAEDQFAVVHYTGVLWRDGKQFDSSWDRDEAASPLSFRIGTAGIIPAWNEGLAGKPVGSRVLLVVPPDKGYGKDGQPDAGIGPTDTMVFVVDILRAY